MEVSDVHDAMPLVSIVIPTFRRPELLKQRALRSALAQQYLNLEVVVVLDGPDPETVAALHEVDPRVRIVELREKQGVSAARNAGVRHSTGEYIALLDDDDEWRPGKLAAQVASAQRSAHHYPVVLSGMVVRMPTGDALQPHRALRPGERIGDYMLARKSLKERENLVTASSIFAPRALLQRLPFTVGLRSQEDWDWILRAEGVPGVGFEQVPPEPETVVLYYFGENRERGSRHNVWDENLEWAQRLRGAGRLSSRAFAGFLLAQLAPRAAAAGDRQGLLTLGKALLGANPTPLELGLFLKHFLVPATWRRQARDWLDARRQMVRL